MTRARGWLMILALAGFGAVGGCSDDDEAPRPSGRLNPEQTGAVCDVPGDCYPKIADKSTIHGTIECMTQVRDGYCTHTCTVDTDCCAANGECETDLHQVCSPFESEPTYKCFLSCEDAHIGSADANEFCQQEAGTDFECRSSGGGSDNRKICMPCGFGVGAMCSASDACGPGLDCIDVYAGGYCGRADCTLDADCPDNSRCIAHPNGHNYCLKLCTTNGDCAVCRDATYAADCRSDVTFVDPLLPPESVCVPR